MISIFKTIDNQLTKIDQIEKNCWINLKEPTESELFEIQTALNIDPDFLKAPMDEEETSRIESEDGQTLIVIDAPYIDEEQRESVSFMTIPIGIIIAKDVLITITSKESAILNDFEAGIIKQVQTSLKTRFFLQILYRVATRYLIHLRQIDKISKRVEKELHRTMKNQDLFQLFDLEKSLVFFSTSLKANEATLEKIQRGRSLKLYEEDQDLLDDILIEMKQGIEMANIYGNILNGTMGAFASIISNNLNIVMKVLTVITILMAIPTMFASFYGMNVVHMPYPNFWFVVIFSIAVTIITAFILFKKRLF